MIHRTITTISLHFDGECLHLTWYPTLLPKMGISNGALTLIEPQRSLTDTFLTSPHSIFRFAPSSSYLIPFIVHYFTATSPPHIARWILVIFRHILPP